MSLPVGAGEPANAASPNLAVPLAAAVYISVLHLQHSNINWDPPSADHATKSDLPSAGNAAAGYKPAGRTGQRPVFRI